MKPIIKAVSVALLLIAALSLLCGCSIERSPYEINDSENFTVSVKYDANGGTFTTNTSVIVDSYNISTVAKNDKGLAEIALIAPDSKERGHDAFSATMNGHFLAGWYAERFETTDEDGNTAYTYKNKWDFEKGRLEVDPEKTYTSETPVLTLYAAWVPLFEVEFYSLDSGELTDTLVFDPTTDDSLTIPAWDEETGAIEMFDFPERKGYTFNGAYLDSEGKVPCEGESITHPGKVDIETGTAESASLKLYIDWTEGEWFRIYNAEQFSDNASLTGHYELYADIDFADEIWPTSFMYGNFEGEIIGNGHTMKNIEVTQTNNSKVNAGLFGNLTDKAVISDVVFENVTFTVKAGTRVVGTSYGLFAGTISANAAVNNVKILESTLCIDSSCYFGADDYTIGLVCGMGDHTAVSEADITCKAAGDEPESLSIKVNGNAVTVEMTE